MGIIGEDAAKFLLFLRAVGEQGAEEITGDFCGDGLGQFFPDGGYVQVGAYPESEALPLEGFQKSYYGIVGLDTRRIKIFPKPISNLRGL